MNSESSVSAPREAILPIPDLGLKEAILNQNEQVMLGCHSTSQTFGAYGMLVL